MWIYLSEGKNHVVYSNGPQILRVRKTQNKKFYNNPGLMDEMAYNQLFLQNIMMKNEVLNKYVQHTENIEISKEMLQKLEKSKTGEIDEDYKYGQIMHNYRNPKAQIMFEIKPKSVVPELFPSDFSHDVPLLSKFQIVQRSRCIDGLQSHICKYEPSDLFGGNIDKALTDLLEFKDEAMQQYASFDGEVLPLETLKEVLPPILSEIAKIQNLCQERIEDIASLYKDLIEPLIISSPESQFSIISDLLTNFNPVCSSSDLNVRAWHRILLCLVANTAKDFTIML